MGVCFWEDYCSETGWALVRGEDEQVIFHHLCFFLTFICFTFEFFRNSKIFLHLLLLFCNKLIECCWLSRMINVIMRLKEFLLRSGVFSYKFCNVESWSLTIGKVEARRTAQTPKSRMKEELRWKCDIGTSVGRIGLPGGWFINSTYKDYWAVCIWLQLSTQHCFFFLSQ